MSERIRVIIAGTRKLPGLLCLNTTETSPVKWLDGLLCMAFKTLHPHYEIEVVSGNSGDVDLLGEKWARWAEAPVKLFPADWDKYGNPAGPIRNRQMAKYAHALVLIWDGKSRGSKNMREEATRRGLRIIEVRI